MLFCTVRLPATIRAILRCATRVVAWNVLSELALRAIVGHQVALVLVESLDTVVASFIVGDLLHSLVDVIYPLEGLTGEGVKLTEGEHLGDVVQEEVEVRRKEERRGEHGDVAAQTRRLSMGSL